MLGTRRARRPYRMVVIRLVRVGPRNCPTRGCDDNKSIPRIFRSGLLMYQLTSPSFIVQDFLLHLVQNSYRASGPHYHDLAVWIQYHPTNAANYLACGHSRHYICAYSMYHQASRCLKGSEIVLPEQELRVGYTNQFAEKLANTKYQLNSKPSRKTYQ
jgi:hypothetical protein